MPSSALALVEPGLIAHAEYPLQEFMTDVGRIDILCVDKEKRLVVIELKAGLADDRAVGQIARYMGWVKQNLPEGPELRGILICLDATPGARAACHVVSNLQILICA
jgi:RecB family endonuclease NucS